MSFDMASYLLGVVVGMVGAVIGALIAIRDFHKED